MKLYKLFTIAALGLLACACDNINENDRFIEVEKVQPKRVVLLEEFTGQSCTNCPQGHERVRQLIAKYGESVIPVSIHASNLSIAETPEGGGLAIPEGEAIYTAAGRPSLPSGVIDRVSGRQDRSQWDTWVSDELAKETSVEMTLTAGIAAGDDKIAIEVNILPTETLDANLHVWILESGIVTYQYDNGKHVTDYVHNHVLRAVVGSTDGTGVALKKGVYGKSSFEIALKSRWNRDNLSVVAFLANKSGVLQAVEAHVAVADNQ